MDDLSKMLRANCGVSVSHKSEEHVLHSEDHETSEHGETREEEEEEEEESHGIHFIFTAGWMDGCETVATP